VTDDRVRRVAEQWAAGLAAADLEALSGLLASDVRWGPPGDPEPPCQSREQVLRWYGRGRESGARARVTEAVVAGDQILVGLRVTRSGADSDRWQVLTVRGAQVSAIVGFDDRQQAAAWAGLAATGP
jgi:hypothetical protein